MSTWFWRAVATIRAFGAGATLWAFLTSQIAAVYLWGPLLTAWRFIAGWREGVPTPYLLAACSLIFGGISWGSLQLSIILERNKIRGRFRFIAANFYCDWEIMNNVVSLRSVQYGLFLDNISYFPIQYRFGNATSNFSGRVAQDIPFLNRGAIIMERANGEFKTSTIALNPPITIPDGQELEHFSGEIVFDLLYGVEGKMKYPINHTLKTDIVFDRKNLGRFPMTWTYKDNEPRVS
jgi:hypothetical protein